MKLRNKGQGSIEVFGLFRLLVIVGCVLAGLLLCTAHIRIQAESGQHTGYVVESGYRGFIWPTHYIKTVDSQVAYSASENSYWYYGVDEKNLNLFNQARAVQQNKTLVTIGYECKQFIWLWESSESCIITSLY